MGKLGFEARVSFRHPSSAALTALAAHLLEKIHRGTPKALGSLPDSVTLLAPDMPS